MCSQNIVIFRGVLYGTGCYKDFVYVCYAPLQNCEKWLLTLSCLAVRLSVGMEQLGSQWVDFCEIWYVYFSKIRLQIQVSLKSDKNIGYFT
jgi:hypothetical protein